MDGDSCDGADCYGEEADSVSQQGLQLFFLKRGQKLCPIPFIKKK
jgi:hypothetical protein